MKKRLNPLSSSLIPFLFLLFFINPDLQGQSSAGDADSLLQKGSELYYQGNIDGALESLKAAAEIDAALGEPRRQNLGYDYGWIGECFRVSGEYEDSLLYFGKAVSIFQELNDPLSASIYQGNSGWVYIQLGEYERAEDLFSRALEAAISRSSNSPEDPGLTYASLWASHLGELKHITGDLKEMVRYNLISLEYARTADMENQIYITANNLANGYAQLGEYESAIPAYEEALEIAKKYYSGEYVFQQLSNITGTYLAMFNYREAEERGKAALAIAEETGDPGLKVAARHLLGRVYTGQSLYGEAVLQYKAALEIHKNTPDTTDRESTLNFLGKTYSDWGRYREALVYFEEGLEEALKAGDEEGAASSYNNIGSVHHHLGEYHLALKYYEMGLEIDRRLNYLKDTAIILNNIASIFDIRGEYDRAVEYYAEALDIAESQGWPEDSATYLNNIGLVYMSWGKYSTAEEYFLKALGIAEKTGNPDMLSLYTGNLGLLAITENKYDKALPYLTRALEWEERIGNRAKIGITYNNIGTVYHSKNDFDRALNYYEKALAIAEETGQANQQISYRNNIAQLYQEQGEFQRAVEIYLSIIPLSEAAGEGTGLTTMYTNLGATYYEMGNYKESIPYFIKSIEILEQLRLTAPGEIRRDYLDKQIHNYQWLITAYYETDQLAEAFGVMERSSAKYLLEQLGGTSSPWDTDEVYSFMDTLEEDEAVLAFANSRWPEPLRFIITEEAIRSAELPKNDLIHTVFSKFEQEIMNKTKLGGGDLPEAPKSLVKSTTHSIILEKKFEALLSYYRYLLSKPIIFGREAEALDSIGKTLYLYLFGGTEDVLRGKKRITIIPDGMLALIPFETIITPRGDYLVEQYDINYIQSLSVARAVRNRTYPLREKELLAFGGAVYNPISYESDMAETEEQYRKLTAKIKDISARGESLRSAYGQLGYGEIANLPGSLAEVKAIQEIIPSSSLYTGREVSEERVKALSGSGELKKYRILHFAVHGVVVPEVPELSAIILSQEKDESTGEDGFLTVQEITGLAIQADFVNLSACETGLGKLYGGEGVVGLTQSFLVAGAKGLSVSLWKVSDDATTEFMTGVYALTQSRGIGFSQAIAIMKRQFIKDPARRKPFYWAPFVYYGE